MLMKTYVVPHPPIILPEIGRGKEEEIRATMDSFDRVARDIARLEPETLILISPHAPAYRDGFYMGRGDKSDGSMANFGRPDLTMSIENDWNLADAIASGGPDLVLAYEERLGNQIDHGGFVPLYFIRQHYSNFKLVRLGISGLPASDHYRLGKLIRSAIDRLGCKTVIVASGDLSHILKEEGPYGFKEAGPVFDEKLVDVLSKADFEGLMGFPDKMIEEAAQCGIRSFQIMAGAWDGDAVSADFLSYEKTFGVGYAVLIFSPLEGSTGSAGTKGESGLARSEEDPYISLARETIYEYIKNRRRIEPPADLPQEMLTRRAATFVTLYKGGELRGCIGSLAPVRENIAMEVIGNAISSSTRDPRFPAVGDEELKDLVISVDVLEEPEAIDSLDQLDPKIYGVIVSNGYRRGVLLPNLEGIDEARMQVDIALRKAGIHPDEGYAIERFKVVRHD